MSVFIIYLIKANIALAIFYLAYRLGLRRLTFYTLNRIFLLFGILFSVTFPLININGFFSQHEKLAGSMTYYAPNWQALQQYMQPETFTVWNWIEYTFWAGVILMAIRFSLQLLSLLRIHLRTKKGILLKEKVRLMPDRLNPFSFFKNIYVNPSLHTEDELKNILLHERIHVKGLHSLDIIAGELNNIFYWFNPGAWLMKTAIRENLEFITDRKILQSGTDAKAYQYSLLQVSHIPFTVTLANSFNFSHLKQRISMMNRKSSSNIHVLRYLLLLPAVAGIILAFTTSRADSKAAPERYTERTINTRSGIKENKPVSKNLLPVRNDTTVPEVTFTPPKITTDSAITFSPDNSYSSQAYEAAQKKEYDKAAELAKKALQENPDDHQAEKVLNYVRQVENYQQKIAEYQQKKKSAEGQKRENNKDAAAAYQAAQEKDYDKAVTLAKKALQSDPNNAEATQVLKYVQQLKDYQQQMVDYRERQSSFKNKNRLKGDTGNLSFGEPLYIIDGKTSDKEALSSLSPGSIQSVNVLKGERATSLYGAKASQGVIKITTRKNEEAATKPKVIFIPPAVTKDSSYPPKSKVHFIPPKVAEGDTQTAKNFTLVLDGHNHPPQITGKPLFVIDGVQKDSTALKNINPDDIYSISVSKGTSATSIYGDKAKNGVIVIYTKDYIKSHPTESKDTTGDQAVVTHQTTPSTPLTQFAVRSLHFSSNDPIVKALKSLEHSVQSLGITVRSIK